MNLNEDPIAWIGTPIPKRIAKVIVPVRIKVIPIAVTNLIDFFT
jgi:hypothetical protein